MRNAAEEATDWQTFTSSGKKEIWQYTEFKSQQGTWKKARRTIYSRLIEHDSQLSLPGLDHDGVIITNLGMGEAIDGQLSQAAEEKRINAHSILGSYHGRGKDELANRALKNFGHEQLPFKDFISNTAWYYLMLVGKNLFEAFKEDVSEPVISISVYADTFRRQFLDTAGKLVRHAGKLILKVPKTTFERLQLDRLFRHMPAIVGAHLINGVRSYKKFLKRKWMSVSTASEMKIPRNRKHHLEAHSDPKFHELDHQILISQ